jgi:DNA-binding MarR family transcriptional regulator
MEDRQAFVEREKEYRRRALEALYDRWRAPDLRGNVPAVEHTEIAALLGVTPDDAVRVLQHLLQSGLAESVGDAYLYQITLLGRAVVETPGRLDEVLPPPVVNIISAGRDMHISGTVQQGVGVSGVRVEWGDVALAIPELRHAVEGEVEDDRIRECVSAYLDDIEAEARKPNPDGSVAHKALNTIWLALQASAALKTLYPLLQALANSLGCLLPPLPS